MLFQNRRDRFRPFRLALVFTAVGESIYFLVWGLWLYPAGNTLGKLTWTVTCAATMAFVIGIAVSVLAFRKPDRMAALVGTAILYVVVLSICTLICYGFDSHFDYFGGASDPGLFVIAGLIPAAISAFPYAWLLNTAKGQSVLERLGI